MKNHKKLVETITIAVLISLACVLSIFDRYISQAIFSAFPFFGLVIPVTFKLGIANIVILIILYNYKFKSSLLAIILKSIVVSIFSIVSFFTSFFISFCGTFLSFIIMYILIQLFKSNKLTWFVSAIGGFCHALGQILANICLYLIGFGKSSLGSIAIMAPFILVLGLITGIFMGLIAQRLNLILKKHQIINKKKEDE